mmetsp:Transcript_158277/g.288573  ORF Transcript_158277/g.288573 Transcript_158277/m.288573 type:complete len:1871 (-) Transcript_158277:101-5713(-)
MPQMKGRKDKLQSKNQKFQKAQDRLQLIEDDQESTSNERKEYAKVVKLMGAKRAVVVCQLGERLCTFRGSMRWFDKVREQDVVLAAFANDTPDVIGEIYGKLTDDQYQDLDRAGRLPACIASGEDPGDAPLVDTEFAEILGESVDEPLAPGAGAPKKEKQSYDDWLSTVMNSPSLPGSEQEEEEEDEEEEEVDCQVSGIAELPATSHDTGFSASGTAELPATSQDASVAASSTAELPATSQGASLAASQLHSSERKEPIEHTATSPCRSAQQVDTSNSKEFERPEVREKKKRRTGKPATLNAEPPVKSESEPLGSSAQHPVPPRASAMPQQVAAAKRVERVQPETAWSRRHRGNPANAAPVPSSTPAAGLRAILLDTPMHHVEGSCIPAKPGEALLATFVLVNVGVNSWPADLQLKLVFPSSGFSCLPSIIEIMEEVQPLMTLRIPVMLKMPQKLGLFTAIWNLQSRSTAVIICNELVLRYDVGGIGGSRTGSMAAKRTKTEAHDNLCIGEEHAVGGPPPGLQPMEIPGDSQADQAESCAEELRDQRQEEATRSPVAHPAQPEKVSEDVAAPASCDCESEGEQEEVRAARREAESEERRLSRQQDEPRTAQASFDGEGKMEQDSVRDAWRKASSEARRLRRRADRHEKSRQKQQGENDTANASDTDAHASCDAENESEEDKAPEDWRKARSEARRLRRKAQRRLNSMQKQTGEQPLRDTTNIPKANVFDSPVKSGAADGACTSMPARSPSSVRAPRDPHCMEIPAYDVEAIDTVSESGESANIDAILAGTCNIDSNHALYLKVFGVRVRLEFELQRRSRALRNTFEFLKLRTFGDFHPLCAEVFDNWKAGLHAQEDFALKRRSNALRQVFEFLKLRTFGLGAYLCKDVFDIWKDLLRLPLYTASKPPPLQSLVVVHCNNMGDDGAVWGSLPEWGGCAKAYLAPGDIVDTKKTQNSKKKEAILREAKQHVCKNDFVAEVFQVQIISAIGDSPQYQVRLDRKSVSKDEEKQVLATWHRAKDIAQVVDCVAMQTGILRLSARQSILYPGYDCSSVKKELDRRLAAESLLVSLGRLPKELLQSVNILSTLHECISGHHISADLLSLCVTERQSRQKPNPVSQTCELSGSISVHAIRAVARFVEKMDPPRGCSPLQVTFEGKDRYKITTECVEDDSDMATSFLQLAIKKANRVVSILGKSPRTAAPQPAVWRWRFLMEKLACGEARQPTKNILVIGEPTHGKSTLIQALTGTKMNRHSKEKKGHGKTIQLGFANCCICRCADPNCKTPESFQALPGEGNEKKPVCQKCGGPSKIVSRVSFIDCPGHSEYMATMLSGASSFDAVLLVAAANQPCPSPQAAAHLAAIKASGRCVAGRVAVIQTKAELAAADLEEHASAAQIRLKGTVAENAPFLPIAALQQKGLDAVVMWLASLPERPLATRRALPRMHALRSFPGNSPGTGASTELEGGLIGGSLARGTVRIGDVVEIRPGHICEAEDKQQWGKSITRRSFKVQPLQTPVVRIRSGDTPLSRAVSGGLVSLCTELAPSMCAGDKMAGCVVGLPGTLPPIWEVLHLTNIASISLGTSTSVNCDENEDQDDSEEHLADRAKMEKEVAREQRLLTGDWVRLTVGSACIEAYVTRARLKANFLEVNLSVPLCAAKGDMVAIEKQMETGNDFCLVAHAAVCGGEQCQSDTVGDAASSGPRRIPEDAELEAEVEEPEAESPVIDCAFLRERLVEQLEGKKEAEELAAKSERKEARGQKQSGLQVKGGEGGNPFSSILNFGELAADLNRPVEHFQAFLLEEKLKCSLAGGNALRVNHGKDGQRAMLADFRELRKRYEAEYVRCHECGSTKTCLDRSQLKCLDCQAPRFVKSLK